MDTFNVVLYSILPTFLYIFFIYTILPYNTFSLKTSSIYWAFGALSVLLVMGIYKLYPDWYTIPDRLSNIYVDKLGYLHVKYFIQIALLEETSKMVMFLLVPILGSRLKMFKDITPSQIMIYCGIVALGFSGIENIFYGINVNNPGVVLKFRSISAVPAHFIFGLYMGYFIAKGRLALKIKHKSFIDSILNNKVWLRKIIYGLFGLFVAIILHGIYNLHIALNKFGHISGTYIFLFICTFGVYFCYRDLKKINSQ